MISFNFYYLNYTQMTYPSMLLKNNCSMNLKFSLKYLIIGCFVFVSTITIYFYQKNTDQLLESKLFDITQKIKYQDLHLNQLILKLHFDNQEDDLQITHSFYILNTLYEKLNHERLELIKHNNLIFNTKILVFYQQLQEKKQTVEIFKRNRRSFNQHLTEFLFFAEKIMRHKEVNGEIKYKVFQIQQLVLLNVMSEKASKISPSIIDLTKEIEFSLTAHSTVNQEIQQFLHHAQLLVNDSLLFHHSVTQLVQSQNFILGESLEQFIVGYFHDKHKEKQQLQNALAILIILGSIYILYLVYLIKIKSDKLNKLLDDTQKQQFALNQHAIVSSADVKGNIIYVNDKFCQISGYTPEELIGKNHRIVKSGHHSNEEYRQIWRTICRGKIWHGQIKNKKKNGGFYWVNASIVPFLDEKNKPYQYISIRTDITLQKELEKKLVDGQHFLEQVTNTIAQGLYAVDINGICTFWNQGAEAILGWTAQELIGKKIHSLIHTQNAQGQAVLQSEHFIYDSVLKNTLYSSEDEFFTHKNGKVLPIAITAVPLLEKNNMIGLVAVFSDITKRKADEKIISQAIFEAQQANRAKSDFLANMSHEIRTPMNGVIGMTELALETDLSPEQREYLEIVKDSSTALLGIINDILDFSKIEAGKLSLEIIEFDLKNLLQKIFAMLMTKAREKGVQLWLENLDDQRLPTQLMGDPGRLRQVLVNLLGNALKFTPHGSVTMRVELQEKLPQRCCLLFKVVDTGIGIPLDKQETIFDAFSQADTSVSRQFGGTGLGLSISKQLIELMGGRLGLESQPNVGTTFFFTCWFGYVAQPQATSLTAPQVVEPSLLLTQYDEPMNVITQNVATANVEASPLLKILLAEDNFVNQKLAKKLLEKQGYSVEIANDGLEAIALFQQRNFDLILMDFQMPNMNGLEATAEIRALEQQRGGHILIIAMTANAMQEDKDRALNAGMDAYLPKPINVQELLAQIRAFFPVPAATANHENEESLAVADICNWQAALARLGNESEILQMMVGLFLEEQQGYLNAIKQALENQDAVVLQRELHTLKGICATLGAETIEAALVPLESLAVQAEFAQIRVALVQIEAHLQVLTRFLTQKIQAG